MVTVDVVGFAVQTGVELDGDEGSGDTGGDVGEETEVLAGDGPWRRGGVAEDEAEAEARALGDVGEDGEDEGGGERGEPGRVPGRVGYDRELLRVENAA